MAGFCFNHVGACSELVCFEWPLGLHSQAEILFSCQASLATVGGGAPVGWMPWLIKNEACCCLQTSIRVRPPPRAGGSVVSMRLQGGFKACWCTF